MNSRNLAKATGMIDQNAAYRSAPKSRSARNVALVALVLIASSNLVLGDERAIRFNRDIRPILSETCFHCHGPDERGRQADLRLDIAHSATEDRGGYQAIAPGKLEFSEAWKRIISDEADLLMPPPDSHMKLTADQKTLLRRWIETGAEYEGHWAFASPTRPDVPQVDLANPGSRQHAPEFPRSEQTEGKVQSDEGSRWGRNDIDAFIAARLLEADLSPAREADSRILLRRLSFDLLGLPPKPEDLQKFVEDYAERGEVAYQEAVTRLLASRHFGERMAVAWLDQARYADSNGYSIDGGRHMWMWRDWVIEAYNRNLPFDQFLTQQLAGDLMPDATTAELVASGFNRNHMVTHEGGTIPEENLTNYVADRVKTTSEVFLGLTMGCAQCHDHKYDPISQKEYYEFFAFFNELDDRGLDGNAGINPAPQIMAKTVLPTDELDSLRSELSAARRQWLTSDEGFDDWLASVREQELKRGDRFQTVPLKMLDASSPNRPGDFTIEPDGSILIPEPARGLNAFSHALQVPDGHDRPIDGIRIRFLPYAKPNKPDSQRKLTPFEPGVPQVTTVLVSAGELPAKQVDFYEQKSFARISASSFVDGFEPANVSDERNLQWWKPTEATTEQHLTITFEDPIDPHSQPFLSVMIFFGVSDSISHHWQIEAFSGTEPDSLFRAELAAAIVKPPAEWTNAESLSVFNKFHETAEVLEPLRVRMANLRERIEVLTKSHPTMVMNTAKRPRETFVLARGQYDAPLGKVEPSTPAALPPLTVSSQATRLDLARWLCEPNHPLTARVAVNRLWSLFFGNGIVASSADFGSQGEWPSHPELLDYMAIRFIESGWDQKALIRDIVSSAAYRQDSSATRREVEIDPKNRLLARGPRFRLQAEFIRDAALATSGLLVDRIGGPSVAPYQPPSLWKEVSHFGSTPATMQVFVQDHGEKLYRRSLYTVTKRTSPHPAMSAFDAPNRELCTIQRGVTNTPMQALVMLNDPQFAEAARVLAEVILRSPSNHNEKLTDDQQRIILAFERVTSRLPRANEVAAIMELLHAERQRYADSPESARQTVAVGEWPCAEGLDPVELAAWSQIAAALMNLSETLTRN